MTAKVVSIATDGAGAASLDVRLYGVIHAVALRLGTLSTPDIEILDYLTSTPVVAVAGVAANTIWYPRIAVSEADGTPVADIWDRIAASGSVRINITGGGASKSGEIVLIYE